MVWNGLPGFEVCNFSLQELRVVQEHLQRQGLRLSTCQVALGRLSWVGLDHGFRGFFLPKCDPKSPKTEVVGPNITPKTVFV